MVVCSNKTTRVRKVSLSGFEQDENAELVQHPITWMGLTYSPVGTPVEIIDRARWLLDHQPPTYWVAHRNCEYIANWCATGDFESFQTKGAIAGKAILLDVPFILTMRKLSPRARYVLSWLRDVRWCVARRCLYSRAHQVPRLVSSRVSSR